MKNGFPMDFPMKNGDLNHSKLLVITRGYLPSSVPDRYRKLGLSRRLQEYTPFLCDNTADTSLTFEMLSKRAPCFQNAQLLMFVEETDAYLFANICTKKKLLVSPIND